MRFLATAACLIALAAAPLAACTSAPSTSPIASGSATTSASAAASASSSSAGEARPNVILIVLDDLDLAAFAGVPELAERMASQGVTFASAFVTDPLCCPSRVSILTGQYVHNHGVLNNTLPDGGFGRFHQTGGEESTLAVWLQDAGYRTALIGKYLNGYPTAGVPPTYVPPGWDEWHAFVDNPEYTSYRINENGELADYSAPEAPYVTDLLAERSASVIEAAADDPRPLFLVLTPLAPHAPATPASRYQDRFADATAPRGPSFDEEDLADKPEWMHRLSRLEAAHVTRMDELFRGRLQSLLAVNDLLDQLDTALEGAAMQDDTYLILTSDNGFHTGQHRLPAGKGTPYEEDIRVPLVIGGPMAVGGSSTDALVSLVDLAPTILDLAGATAPRALDGRSLVPLLAGSTPDGWRSAILVEHVRTRPGARQVPTYDAVRTATEVYVEYEQGDRELYDLTTDPFQLANGIASAEAERLTLLASLLAELRACAGETCLAADSAR